MSIRFRTAFLLLLCLLSAWAAAQNVHPVKWSARLEPSDIRAGEVGVIVVHADIEKDWHIYSLKDTAEAVPTSFSVPAGVLKAAGDPQSPPPIVKFDPNFRANTAYHEGTADFRVPVRVKTDVSGAQNAKVIVSYQACAKVCLRPQTEDVAVSFTVGPGAARADHMKVPAAAGIPPAPPAQGNDEFAAKIESSQNAGLPSFLWVAFTYGLIALLTPCVFPMVPITVSYFTKERKDGGKSNLSGALAYCFGIVGTFTGLGLVMTALFGATGLSRLATNAWVNLALGFLFLGLAANLLGIFEIRMPSGLVNRASEKSRSGNGLLAPIFMGLTFSLTSFTCTVPFVGSILAAAAKGHYLFPALGMLAFSLAFAIPFFLLALFPQFLLKLPKSGNWLNTVKVFMGFLEIAFALKFLSNADLVWQAGWLTRGVFLALWATVAIVGGLYLLGGLKLPHHDSPERIGGLRRVFGLASLGAAGLCLAGIQGRKLGEFSAFLPPEPYPGQSSKGEMYLWGDNFDSAILAAKQTHRNIFIDFTGVTCTNCRYMEDNVFPLPSVKQRFDQLVLVRLYTDRPTPGDRDNAALQDRLARVNTLPCYVILSPEGKVLKVHQQQPGLDDEKQFLRALDEGQSSRVALRR